MPVKPVLIYDAECPFCLRFKMALIKLMGPTPLLEFISIQDENLYIQYSHIDPLLVSQELHVISDQGQLLIGTAAITYLLTMVPLAASFVWLIESRGGQKALDFFYQQVKKRREMLINRCGQCN